MTTEMMHDDRGNTPFWQVQSVYDESGSGGDFAYTVGLCGVGFPELHLWARPSFGEDPGHDWKLSSRDQCHVLNELAGLLLDRRIGVGSTLTRRYDGGLATVTYRVDPAEDPGMPEALRVPPGVEVLPVRWSLDRSPEGEPAALSPEEIAAARAAYDEIVRELDPAASPPRGWELPERPSFGLDQRYGPLTPLVLARAAQLWQADDDTICDMLHVAVKVTQSFSLSWAVTRAIALARPVGRRAVLERVQADARALVESLTTRPAALRRWRSIVRRSDPGLWQESRRRQRARIEHNLACALQVLASACLAVETVSDVADRDLVLCGRGPWISGQRCQRIPPGPEWAAAPAVQEVVHAVLVALSPATLMWVAETHRALRDSESPGVDRYHVVCHHLEAWATVSAAGFPSSALQSPSARRQPLIHAPVRVSATAIASLHEWATNIASALTYRARLTADDVDAFVAPYRIRIPDLERILNQPV